MTLQMEHYLDLSCSLHVRRQAVFLKRNRRRVIDAKKPTSQQPLLQLLDTKNSLGFENSAIKDTIGSVGPGAQTFCKSPIDDMGSQKQQDLLHDTNCIKISGVEVHNAVTEIDDLSITEVPIECTLAVFSVTSTTVVGKMHKLGDELVSLKQNGIASSSDKDGIVTRIIFPDEFLIPLEELTREKSHSASEDGAPNQLGVGLCNTVGDENTRMYGLKIVLKILDDCRDLKPFGSIGKGIVDLQRDSGFLDVRMMCKGNLSRKPESRLSLKILLSTDRKLRKTEHRLEARVSWPSASQRISSTHQVPHHAVKAFESSHHTKRPPLRVPQIQQRLFHHDTKQVLVPGEIYTACDHEADQTWRIAKIKGEICANLAFTDAAKDYITKWATFAFPLKISSGAYIPEALLLFVQTNRIWFSERESRMREFGLHATVLRLRGLLTMKDFVKCTRLLGTGKVS